MEAIPDQTDSEFFDTRMTNTDPNIAPEGIAITGMAGRFPGAPDVAAFWDLLLKGEEGITRFTEQEMLEAGVSPETLANPDYVRASGAIRGADRFDAAFFGFSPREAALTDPQQRLFLEIAWHALEDAGCDPGRFDGLIGVFGGAGMNSYFIKNLLVHPELTGEPISLANAITNDKDFLATRVAYKLDLHGPALSVQTACSTSLVATHLAVQSLLAGECDLAIAGGVLVTVPQTAGYLYEPGGIKSPDGHCRAFDAGSQGTVGGSGAAIVALRRLEDALAGGDRIYAVIRGSAVNNDGAGKVGFTAPSMDGQAAVIAEALAIAGFDAGSISYVEAHGTGTQLGDPVEVAALTAAFRQTTDRRGYCAIGSVKTNVGHLDAAAGVTGLIKTALSLYHRKIPASLHFKEPNPEIDFESSPFFVNARLRDWEAGEGPRRAGVSSFGIGGTNAHVVLEETPQASSGDVPAQAQLVLLSARSAIALERASGKLAAFLAERPASLPDVAYTLQIGRKRFRHRRTVVAGDSAELAAALEKRAPNSVYTREDPADTRPLVYLFPGQGAQHAGMLDGIYRSEPRYRRALDRCAEMLEPWLDVPLGELLQDGDMLGETRYTQPAIFSVSYALASLFEAWGLQPDAMLGHSLGEYTAACLAGVFSLPDALRVVCARGAAMSACEPGAMLSVSLSEEEAQPLLSDGVVLAATNHPAGVVLAGPTEAIGEVESALGGREIPARRLHTSHAFHTPLMAPAQGPFRAALAEVTLQPPQIPFVSNVTGDWIRPEQAVDPEYWVDHLLAPVRFSQGMRTLQADPQRVYLEVGPGTALTTLARLHFEPGKGDLAFAAARHPRQAEADRSVLLAALGRLWATGLAIDWQGFHWERPRRKMGLPGYPFERKRHWIQPGPAAPRDRSAPGISPERREDVSRWFYAPSWQRVPLPAGGRAEGQERWWLAASPNAWRAGFAEALDSGPLTLSIDLDAPQAAFDQALDAALTQGPPDRVVFAPDPDAETDPAFLFSRLAILARTLSAQAPVHPIRLAVVTAGLHRVTGVETLRSDAAPLIGLVRCLPQEIPTLQVSGLDWERQPEPRQLLDELKRGPGVGLVAYRGPYRWQQVFVPAPLPVPEGKGSLKPGGVYLVTGGFGSIGGVIAGLLAELPGARLALLGRSPGEVPDLDAEVLPLRADVSNRKSMRIAVKRILDRWGRLDGVFHAAGYLGPDAFVPIQELEDGHIQAHFKSKVAGVRELALALEPVRPDFIMLFSSLSTVLGGLGYAAYAGANAYLDAFAAARRATGETHWLSVAWDAWDLDGRGAGGIRPDEGRDAVQRILGADFQDGLVVSIGDLQEWVKRWTLPAGKTEAPPEGEMQQEMEGPGPNFVAPRSQVEKAIAAVWSELLGIPHIGLHDNFFELGGHSLLAIQVASRLRRIFSREIAIQDLFDAQTVAELAARLESEEDELDELASMLEGLTEEEIDDLLGGR